MRIILLFLISIFYSCQLFKLSNKEYIFKKEGILFISWNNPDYIDSLKFKDDINKLFLRDIFLPLDSFDSSKSLKSNFIGGGKGKGIELGVLNERPMLDSLALRLNNDSIISPCYSEKGFSIVPVILTYKKISDFPKIENCGNKVTLSIGKNEVQFEYETFSIEVIKIELLRKYLH